MLKASLVGNLGGDPELRYSAQSSPVLTFNVATNTRQKVGDAWQDRTEWVRCRVLGTRAASLSNLLHKGSRVFVDGRLEARPWTTREGEIRAGLEVLADVVEFMSSRQEDQGSTAQPGRPMPERVAVGVGTGAGRQADRSGPSDDPEMDLPF